MPTVIRNKKLFCINCGGEHPLPLPMPITEMTGKMDSFSKLHKNCPQTWTEPKADMTKSVEERANWWLEKGEQGRSSVAMWRCFMGLPNDQKNHPCDPDDFSRCYKLLEAIPEWKEELNKLRTLSPQWNKLVCNWDILTEMFEKESYVSIYARINEIIMTDFPTKNTIVAEEDIINAGYVTDELKPCPFCGGKKILTCASKNPNGNVGYRVWCATSLNPYDCTASMTLCLGKEDTMKQCRKELVEKWNTRK